MRQLVTAGVRAMDSRWALLVLLAAAAIVYTWDLGSNPVHLNQDELGFTLNAYSLATSGVDESGRAFPLYFRHLGLGWSTPYVVYLPALALKVLPLSEATIRLPTAAAGLLGIGTMYFVGTGLFARPRHGLISAGLLATSPAYFLHSRILLDNFYPLPFVIGWLYLVHRFHVRRRGPGTLFLAGLLLGIGVHSYHATKIMMPLYLLGTLALIGTRGWRDKRLAATLIVGFVLPLLPLVPWLAAFPDTLVDQVREKSLYDPNAGVGAGLLSLLSPESLALRLRVFVGFFSPVLLFGRGDASLVHTTGRSGVFALALAPLIAAGIWHAVHSRDRFEWLLVAGFITAPIAAALVAEPARVSRALVIIPFGVLLAAVGFRQLAGWVGASRLAAAGFLVLAFAQFVPFHVDYWDGYRARAAAAFKFDVPGALRAVVREDDRHPANHLYLARGIDFVDDYWRFVLIQARRPDLASKTTIFPEDAAVVVPPDSLVLLRTNQTDRLRPEAGTRISLGASAKIMDIIREPDGYGSFFLYRTS
jgi:hypothetical protein